MTGASGPPSPLGAATSAPWRGPIGESQSAPGYASPVNPADFLGLGPDPGEGWTYPNEGVGWPGDYGGGYGGGDYGGGYGG